MRTILLSSFATILICTACSSSESGSEDGASAATSKNAPSCSIQADFTFVQANEAATERARKMSCDTPGLTVLEVANSAGAAVKECASYASVIANDPDAQPIRDALKGTLALGVVTGKVKMKGSSVTGLKAALESGVSLFVPPLGAFGNTKKLIFAPKGVATFEYTTAVGATLQSNQQAAQWSVDETKGTLTIDITGQHRVYTATETKNDADAVPHFDFRDESDGNLVDPDKLDWQLVAIPSECES